MKNFKLSSIIYIISIIIIPQINNSPTGRADFLMKKEQDNAFVDHDMTSYLTGDESLGSAHKSYKNSLVRKERSSGSGKSL